MKLEKIIGAAALAAALFAGGRAHAQEAPSAPAEKPAAQETAQQTPHHDLKTVETIYDLPELSVQTHKIELEDVTDRVMNAAGTDDFERITDILDGLKIHSPIDGSMRTYLFYPEGRTDNLEEMEDYGIERIERNHAKNKKHIGLMENAFGKDHGFLMIFRDKEKKRLLRLKPKYHRLSGISEDMFTVFGTTGFYHYITGLCGTPGTSVRTRNLEDKSEPLGERYLASFDLPNLEMTVFRKKPGENVSSFGVGALPNGRYVIETYSRPHANHAEQRDNSCIFDYASKRVITMGRFSIQRSNQDATKFVVFKDGTYQRLDAETGEMKSFCDPYLSRSSFKFSPDSNFITCRRGEFHSSGSVPGNYSIEVYNMGTGDYFNIHHEGYGSDYVRGIADDGKLRLKGATFELRDGKYVCTRTSSGKPLKDLKITKKAGK